MAKSKVNFNWIGQTIADRYKVEALLGQGGMSTVYKAADPNLARNVAIKIIDPHLLNYNSDREEGRSCHKISAAEPVVSPAFRDEAEGRQNPR